MPDSGFDLTAALVTPFEAAPAPARERVARQGRPANRTSTGGSARPTRIALYSHDTLGLGHARRNLLIAEALAGGRSASILLISGAVESRSFALPPGVDYLNLPALSKDGTGGYHARRLGCSLDDLIALRAETIRGALRAFRPDVFIVDNVPHGAQGELSPALADLRRDGTTRCVLGLRDILDEPETIRAEWARAGAHHLLRDVYDAIWIYGDRLVYDALAEYDFLRPFGASASFTGYLDRRAGERAPDAVTTALIERLDRRNKRLALCTVGGGQDGAEVALAFAHASYPADTVGLVLTGPFMSGEASDTLLEIAARRDDLEIIDFVPEPAPLLERADRVIAMGGYNTTCELLAYGKTALIVPRVRPRREQWIRASRLQKLGALDALHPDELNPEAIGAWLASDRATNPNHAIDLGGLSRLPGLLEELCPAPRIAAHH